VPHSVWTEEETKSIQKTHYPTKRLSDKIAYIGVKILRLSFDTFSGFRFGKLTPEKVLNRCIFLETIAGVPGFTAAIIRHLSSLRTMRRDHGWIHTLLEEAENERMHLLTFIQLKEPGWFFRAAVIIAQGVFMNLFFFAYLISPHLCHRFVGYFEEEAVKTYSEILEALDQGLLKDWSNQPAPPIAISYWRLPQDATLKHLFLAIRADEANHREVNHTFASIDINQKNPFLEKGQK